MQLRVLGIILAGGKGTRLYPLTKERAKPAVPFGGKYRIVDFVLSNFINSGIYSIYVLTQFRSQSLLQHLSEGWQIGGILKNQFIIPVPAQMRSPGETWYQGTSDAIYQNINLVEQAAPHTVAIFGADHIYRMNISHMIAEHQQTGAACTVAAIPVPKRHASEFGVIETAPDNRILAFHEKNPESPTIPGDSDRVFASMGNYLFATGTLLKALHEDAADEDSSHDFGRDILPKLVASRHAIYAYDYQTNKIPGEPEEVEPLLAGRGHDRGLLGGQHGYAFRETGAEPLQPPMASAYQQLSRSAREIHFRRRKPARRSHRFGCLGRMYPFRRTRPELGSGARGQGARRSVD